MSISDDAFLKSISDRSLKDKYIKAVNKLKRKFKPDKEFRQKYENKISDQETHDAYLNIVVFPFIQQNNIGSKLGYIFFACDPFYERE